MNTCPHCGKEALSFWQKIRMGPASVARCRECGSEFSLPYRSALFTLPFLATVLVGFFVFSFDTYFLVATIALVFMVVGRWWFVPLVKVGPPEPPKKKKKKSRKR